MAVKTEIMNTSYTDVREGNRIDIDVEFISRRPIECAGEQVHRLVVADHSDIQFSVLATPDSEPIRDLKTGATHRITGLLGAEPVDSTGDSDADCPDCGGSLRSGQVIDIAGPVAREAAAKLGLDECFGIMDGESTIRRQRENGYQIDDWNPIT